MRKYRVSRRVFVGGVAGLAGTAGLVRFGGLAFAQLKLPTSPVDLNIVDVAGNLALTQDSIETYRDAQARAGLAASPSPRRRRRSCPAS